jgi:hypothetical protein
MPKVTKAKQEKLDSLRAAGGEELRKWVDGLGSDSTKRVWPRVLLNLCDELGRTPVGLIEAATDGKQYAGGVSPTIRDLFSDYQNRMRAKGKMGSTVAFSIKVARSWLAFNGVALPRGFIKVRDSDRVYREAALTREQERAILRSATRRERAAIALARSGLRPEVLGNYLGTNGLAIRDLVDLRIDARARRVSWKNLPARVVVREELSKAHHEYSTFLTSENAEYLAEYLNARLRPGADWKRGEKLGADSPVIAPERDGKHFIRTTNIGDALRNAIRRAGLSARPYVFRTTFQTRLMSAENEGGLSHRLAVFWMGHRGEMTSRYGEQRGDLPAETIGEMRAAFARCEPYLSSVGTERNREATLLSNLSTAVEAATGEKAESLTGNALLAAVKRALDKIQSKADPAPVETVPEAEPVEAAPEPVVVVPPEFVPKRPKEQRSVDAENVGRYLEFGWQFVSPLNSHLAVVRWDGAGN